MGNRTSVAERLRYAADARTPQFGARTSAAPPGAVLAQPSSIREAKHRPEASHNCAERSRGCSGAAMRRPGIRGVAEALCHAGPEPHKRRTERKKETPVVLRPVSAEAVSAADILFTFRVGVFGSPSSIKTAGIVSMIVVSSTPSVSFRSPAETKVETPADANPRGGKVKRTSIRACFGLGDAVRF